MKTGFVYRSLARLAAFFAVSTALHEDSSSAAPRQRLVRGYIGGRDGFAVDFHRIHLKRIRFRKGVSR